MTLHPRTLALIALIVVPILLATSAQAHEPEGRPVLEEGMYLHHTNLHEGTLGPGAWNNTTLAWAGTPLRGWWLLLFSGQVEGDGVLEASVAHEDDVVQEWTWHPGAEDLVVFSLEETGFHELRLHNPGPGNVSYRLYYDNTCDCTSKVAQLDPSPLWFNYNVSHAGRVELEVNVVPFVYPRGLDAGPVGSVRVEAVVATPREPDAAWLDGYEVLRSVDVGLPEPDGESLWSVDLGFEAPAPGTYYILLTVHHDGDDRWQFQVRPLAELPKSQEAPGLGWVGVLAALGCVAGWARRTR